MATRPLDKNEYEEIIKLCKSGFTYIDKKQVEKRLLEKTPH